MNRFNLKPNMIAMALLAGTFLFGQEAADLTGTVKNAEGVFTNKFNALYGTVKFSGPLKKGYYSFTLDSKTNFPMLVNAGGKGAIGGYSYTGPVKEIQKRQYYFIVNDPDKVNLIVRLDVPKSNKEKVTFAAKNLKLNALKDIPGNMFPDFADELKNTADGDNFIYCFALQKKADAVKTAADGVPMLKITGKTENGKAFAIVTHGYPVSRSGKLTVKISVKPDSGSKKMMLLVKDLFWKKGGARKNYTLKDGWNDITFETDCAKSFKDGIVLSNVYLQFDSGTYLVKDFSVNWSK